MLYFCRFCVKKRIIFFRLFGWICYIYIFKFKVYIVKVNVKSDRFIKQFKNCFYVRNLKEVRKKLKKN